MFPDDSPNCETIMAVLFHDIAKPLTIKTPEKHGTDRIRFNNHDQIGARVASDICKRLKLSNWAEGDLDCDKLHWLVKKHLLLVHANVSEIKNNTLEKYFFNPNKTKYVVLKF